MESSSIQCAEAKALVNSWGHTEPFEETVLCANININALREATDKHCPISIAQAMNVLSKAHLNNVLKSKPTLLSDNVRVTYDGFKELFVAARKNADEVFCIKDSLQYIRGLARYPAHLASLNNPDVFALLLQYNMTVVSTEAGPVIVCSSYPHSQLLKQAIATEDESNAIYLWLESIGKDLVVAVSKPSHVAKHREENKASALSPQEHSNTLDSITRAAGVVAEIFSPNKPELCHRAMIKLMMSNDAQEAYVYLPKDKKLQLVEDLPDKEVVKGARVLLQLADIGMQQALLEPCRGKLTFDYTPEGYDSDMEQVGVVIRTIPIHQGVQISFDFLYTKELEAFNPPADFKEETFSEAWEKGGVLYSYGATNDDYRSRLYKYIGWATNTDRLTASITIRNRFPCLIGPSNHLELDSILSQGVKSSVESLSAGGIDTMIIGDIESPLVAELAVYAASLGIRVLCAINARDENQAAASLHTMLAVCDSPQLQSLDLNTMLNHIPTT